MIRIQNIPLPIGGDLELLRRRAAKALGVRLGALEDLILVRQSIDARKKQDVHYVYTVDVSLKGGEEQAVERAGKKNISLVTPKPYVFPEVKRRSGTMPVVVGMGPAGLFAALFLARNGIPCVVLERARTWMPAPPRWRASGPGERWTPSPTCSSGRGARAPSPTGS